MALRTSGQVDLYWNYTLVNECNGEIFGNVDINFEEILLTTNSIEGKKYLKIKTAWDTRIGLDVAEPFECLDHNWHKNFYNMISSQVKIASSLCLFPT